MSLKTCEAKEQTNVISCWLSCWYHFVWSFVCSYIFKLADFGTARKLGPQEGFTSLHGTEEYLVWNVCYSVPTVSALFYYMYVLYAVSCYVRACADKPQSAGYLCGQGGFVEYWCNVLPCGDWKATLPIIPQEGWSAHDVTSKHLTLSLFSCLWWLLVS